MKKVAIIGLGFIGSTIIEDLGEENKLYKIYDIHKDKLTTKNAQYKEAKVMKNLLDFDGADVIIECAVQQVVIDIFDKIISSKKYFIPLSIGAFITSNSLYKKYTRLSEKQKEKVILPSGAIGGFDLINSIREIGFDNSTLITHKPLAIFEKSLYVKEKGIKLYKNKKTLIFDGNAREAAKNFPKSINVAARLALATLGPTQTRVKIFADPTINRNIHTIKVESVVGVYELKFANKPAPTNPRTSWLAALSAKQALRTIRKLK